ncbi:hypothetical protein F4823DRAFT_389647 [Ustulina deusta]|nr:hypothetical protein F4823DRAFT_389647 [Ustulina deusta]
MLPQSCYTTFEDFRYHRTRVLTHSCYTRTSFFPAGPCPTLSCPRASTGHVCPLYIKVSTVTVPCATDVSKQKQFYLILSFFLLPSPENPSRLSHGSTKQDFLLFHYFSFSFARQYQFSKRSIIITNPRVLVVRCSAARRRARRTSPITRPRVRPATRASSPPSGSRIRRGASARLPLRRSTSSRRLIRDELEIGKLGRGWNGRNTLPVGFC